MSQLDFLSLTIQAIRDELPLLPPDTRSRWEGWLDQAELKVRRSLGGAEHYISRMPRSESISAIESLPAGLSMQEIARRTGLTEQYVRRLLKERQQRKKN